MCTFPNASKRTFKKISERISTIRNIRDIANEFKNRAPDTDITDAK